MRVALIPTGRTEWHGLPVALQRLFPGHDFYALPGEALFRSMKGPFNGITSTALTERHEREDVPHHATELVGLAAREALGDGHDREAADLVVVLDDLELANRLQPDRVVRVFRRAAERHLDGLQGARRRTEAALRERVSFHLIVPMIEAWLFGDPQALRGAGVPDGVAPIVDGDDLEDFRTTDEQYLRASEADCPCWIARGRRRKDRPKWLGGGRERHPKGYLPRGAPRGSRRRARSALPAVMAADPRGRFTSHAPVDAATGPRAPQPVANRRQCSRARGGVSSG